MAASLMARLRESQSKPTVQPAPEQMQQSTGQQLPRSLIGVLRQQQASQEKTAPQATARHRNLFEAALQQQEQQMPQNAAQAPQAAERPRNLVEFMLQAQALNQQPDSIPAMMKPGEYVLPPDTVQALGGPQVLDATVAQTHTPANAGAIVPRGFEPRLFFSSGGLAQEEETKQVPTAAPAATAPASAQTPRAQFVADQNAKLAAANTKLAERTQEMNARYQPALNSPTNTFPGNRLPVESGAASAPPAASGAAPAQPSRGAVGFLADAFPGTTAAVQGSMDDAKEAYRQGGFGAALGQSARVAATPLIGLADDVYSSAAKVVRPVTDTALQAGKTFLTGDASSIAPAQQGAAAGPGTTPSTTPQAQSLVNAEEMQRRASAQAAPTGQQVPGLSGVYKHGEGQYSDNAQGMGLPQNLGQPSAQNMQAANALASQQQAQSMARLQAAERQAAPQARGLQGFEMPRQENAYERENRMRERNRIMGMLQTPMTGDPRRDLTASQRQQLVAQLGHESQERQSTERNMFGLAGQQLNAESQRYSADASTAVGADRNTIDQQRVGMEATTKGFDVRQSQRKENAQLAWEKASPEQRSVIKERYPDLFGDKEKKSYSFDVVRGSSDPVTGKREGDYAVVFDPNTGKYRQVQVGQ